MLTIRTLDATHDRTTFDCGQPDLNEFLRKTARQHKDKGLSNTFVLVDDDTPRRILGFFTLSFLEIEVSRLPEAYSRKLPKSSRLPAAKLARLAVDINCQDQRYGALLLADAVKRILGTIRNSGAITGFFVDAKDEKARDFYLHYGFIPLRHEKLKLFLPLATLVNGLEQV